MRKGHFKLFLVLIMTLTVLISGCSIFKGGQKGCGCPSHKGMVGY